MHIILLDEQGKWLEMGVARGDMASNSQRIATQLLLLPQELAEPYSARASEVRDSLVKPLQKKGMAFKEEPRVGHLRTMAGAVHSARHQP